MEFEWDEAKAASNAVKHGVTFDEGMELFAAPRSVDAPSRNSRPAEDRRFVVGEVNDRLVTVIYTQRSGRIRIISARPASIPERRIWRLSVAP